MMLSRRWSVVAAVLLLACVGQHARAQQKKAACDRIGTTTFVLSRTGGNIKPETVELRADGRITVIDQAASPPASRVRTTSPDVMAGLARLAWDGGFVTLRSGPARHTTIRDAAHQTIEVRSACGGYRVEWVGDGAPAQFRELWAILVLVSDAVP
jgi:hypothetical protein